MQNKNINTLVDKFYSDQQILNKEIMSQCEQAFASGVNWQLNKTMKENIIQIPEGFKAEVMEDGNILLVKVGTELPKTWEECLKKIKTSYTIDSNVTNKNSLPSESIAKAMLALSQLLICREVYRDGWVPDWGDIKQDKHGIQFSSDFGAPGAYSSDISPLSFQTAEIRDKFSENFKDLIEEVKELI